MNKYSAGFHSLMSEAGILSSRSFDLYIRDVLGFGSTQDMNLDGFDFEPIMQLGFDYEQLQAENKLDVMATYTDKDSEAIPFGSKGFTTSRGVVPRQKARHIMDEDDYRKYLLAVQQLNFQNESVRDYALDMLFTKLTDITAAHRTSMLYQRDQMVSNRGLTLTAANNPRGLKAVSFTASIPENNVTTLTSTKRWFTDNEKATEGTASDPVNDVRNIVRAIKHAGYLNIVCEVDEVSFFEDMRHSKWQAALGYQLMPALRTAAGNDDNAIAVAAGASDEEIKRAFAAIIGCTVKFRTGLVAIETYDSATKSLKKNKIRSFNPNTYVFYPEGALGTIKVVAPLLPDNGAMYGQILGGKGIIQYEYDAKTKTQDWWSELTALCVPNRSEEMFYLVTK